MGTIIENIKKFVSTKSEGRPDLPDDVTTDKYLRGLRRQRRLQMEELEKVRLKSQIAEFEKNKTKEYMFGIGRKPLLHENRDYMKGRIKKEQYVFKDKHHLIKAKGKYKVGKAI